jgi:NAD(P) transhydrogenase subunit beta
MSDALLETLRNLAYLLASVLFIFALKGLAHPRKAVRGNLLGATGMLIAVVATLVSKGILGWAWIFAGLVVGGLIGAVLATKIQMTAMPQLVGLFNGFGGMASILVAGEAHLRAASVGDPGYQALVATGASGLIGAVTFWGSLVAFGKLQGVGVPDAPVLLPGRHVINALLVVVCLAAAVYLVMNPTNAQAYWIIVGVASVLGILLVIPIGGADMPVVIALLNSYSGLAAAATGFVISNNVLIIAGALVGASGLILTSIMCKAMNRSLANVMFAGVGQEVSTGPSADDVYAGKIKATSAEEVAMLLEGVRRVVFVPGYGMAVAQAQHQVRTLANLLEKAGVEVEFGIHPVAGRMPGHMNVLLAEADVAYDKLKDMDDINPTFSQTDVVIIIGANDVVNPVARTDPSSPIAGMPILDVDKAKTVIMIKRSLSPGFAGIPNPLFALDNTLMYFSDGRQAVQDIVAAVKEAA